MKLYPRNHLPVIEVKKFIVIFYTIGILGFLIPATRNFFIAITPLALLLSTYLLANYHGKYTTREVLVFLIIFILGFFIEAIGVKTGLIFGDYNYGKALGIKLLETPLLIGFNWLFLVYTGSSISKMITIKPGLQLIIAPSLMIAYDLILEQVASKLDMWTWLGTSVPIKNYIAWWIIGFVFVAILTVFKVNTKNPLALMLFVCQFLFFIVLFFVFESFQ